VPPTKGEQVEEGWEGCSNAYTEDATG